MSAAANQQMGDSEEFAAGQDIGQEFVNRLRTLAMDRHDAEVFNLVRPVARNVRLTIRELIVVASVLFEGARLFSEHIPRGKPDEDLDAVVQVVSSVLANAELPAKPSPERAFREYFNATVEWCQALRFTHYVNRFWDVIRESLEIDMRSFPDMREGLVSLAADVGRRVVLPGEIERHVLAAIEKPYFFISPANYLKVLGYALHRRIKEADIAGVAGPWLAAWTHHFSVTNFLDDRVSLFALKDDIHGRLNAMYRTSGLLLLRNGSFAASLVLLVIKLDCRLRLANLNRSKRWLWFLQTLFRYVPVPSAVDREQSAWWSRRLHSDGPERIARVPALKIVDVDFLRGTKRDVVVTRVQGGIGDLIAMRPGLLELRRRRRKGRIIFATNRAFFPAFSADDPIELVDIESATIDTASFGRWINMSDCPATRAEAKELPSIRTSRVDMFARGLGVRLGLFGGKRIRPIAFSPDVEERALELLGDPDGRSRIGIQLRSAETYKDVPVLLEVGRKLSAEAAVYVFDSRPIPRKPQDTFLAIDRERMPVAMAMASKMDLVIAPDSSFLHVAGSNGIRCLLLTGASDGKIRRKPYPTVRYLDVRVKLGCIPCWRNEFQKCALSETFTSICMLLLTVDEIASAALAFLARPPRAGLRLFDSGRAKADWPMPS